jgi:DNA-binding NtrC family response regulator
MKLPNKLSDNENRAMLIASIDTDVKEALRQQLKGHGFCLSFAERGIDVILQILDKNYDSLLIDLDMNGIIGVEVLPVIRKLRPRLPVILISEDYTHRIRQVAAEQGITFQTFKPKTFAEAKAIVIAAEKIMEKRKLLRQNSKVSEYY